MSISDSYYRALTDFKKVTAADRRCEAQNENIKNAVSGEERITVTRNVCVIETDWIEAIEKGLVFVEKAINEERQFIKSNGEVVPIEKAKHVSKDSVEHLARHSDLLTKKPEGDQIIPDKIYNTERLSDFAVYENRFLYMLLCYLRDFIALRYDKILRYTNLYDGELFIKKDVHSGKQRILFEAKLSEKREDDEYLKEHNKAKSLIDRIDIIYKLTLAFLRTPLMEEVSKVSKLRPPVTKTNVLRMNKNFKGAVALYEFVTAYEKDGFTVTPEIRNVNGFFEETGNDFAEALSLYSFLTYEYGLDIKAYLKENYNEEEKRRKAAEREKLKEQINNLRRKIKNGGTSMEEYILLVEKRNRQLEEAETELFAVKKENAALKTDVKNKTEEIASLNYTIENNAKLYEETINSLNIEHEQTINDLNSAHEQEVAELNSEHEQTINDLNAEHEQEKITIFTECEEKLAKERDERFAEVQSLNEAFDKERAVAAEKLVESRRETERVVLEKTEEKARLDRLCGEKDDEIKYLNNEKTRKEEEIIAMAAKYTALRKQQGLIGADEDFTTEETFDELERQFIVLKKMFKEEWKKTKKRIRRENLPFGKKKTDNSKTNEEAEKETASVENKTDENLTAAPAEVSTEVSSEVASTETERPIAEVKIEKEDSSNGENL